MTPSQDNNNNKNDNNNKKDRTLQLHKNNEICGD